MEYSIIIPHYNSPILLDKLLSSIPIKRDLEIIVIDDKSDAKHKGEYNYIKKKFRHVIFLENNTTRKGAGVCRNIGLLKSKGKWIVFADADDYFLPDLYEELSKYNGTDFDIVYFKSKSVELETNKQSDRSNAYNKLIQEFSESKDKQSEINLRAKFTVPWSKMIKKKLIDKEKIHFSETLVSNDVIFSTKTGILAKKINISNTNIYCVTKSKGTLTNIITEEKLKQRFEIFIEQYNFLKTNLEKENFQDLSLTSQFFIINSIVNKFSIKHTFFIVEKSCKNKIPLIKKEPFSISVKCKKIKKFIKAHKQNKKFRNEI